MASLVRPRMPIGTRCCAPRLPDALVRRPRLDQLFDDGRRRPVTLVSAPPGAGKTTLLASWLARASGPDSTSGTGPGPGSRVAWLSLDRRDDDPRRFAELVVAALDRAGALDGPGPGSGRWSRSAEVLLDGAFEQLMGRGEPCVLMIDDLHEVSSGPVLAGLAHLVERAPPVLDLVLASRADPPIGWGRLILDGRLRQVRNAELRFRPDEARQLFAAHGVRLGGDDIRLLCDRTEGWAAGLRLAACALQSEAEPGQFVRSASATQAAVSDYLLKEVLVRQDEASRRFLLRSSVADRLTPDLAMALTGDARAGERLAALERRGVFVVELDEDGSYRYHPLFSALLRARLRLDDPDLLGELHRCAARWHLANGLPLEAEEHARAAGDWDLVGRLVLARWLDATLDGERLPADAVAGVPAAEAARTPELALVLAAEACARSHRDDADLHRDTVNRTAGSAADGDAWRVAPPLLDLAYGCAFGDDPRARAATTVLRDARAGVWTARARRLAALRAAELDVDAGRFAAARRALDVLADADAHADACGDEDEGWVAAEALAVLAVLDAAGGDPARAEERAEVVLAGGDDVRPGAAQAARLALVLSRALRGEHRGALDGFGAVAADPAPLPRALRLAVRAVPTEALRQATARPGVDVPPLDEPLAHQVLVALGLVEIVDAAGRVVRVGGEGEAAVAAARRWLAGDTPGPSSLALERRLAGVEAVDAVDAVGAVDGRADGPAHPRTGVEAAALAAVVADAAGDAEAAALYLDRALDGADRTGILAPFDAHAGSIRPLVERYLARPGPPSTLAVELVDRLAPPDAGALVEPLTDREREVLHHLPTLMSNGEIAAGMHLSVNTVKTHLKAVYRKLGVEGRRQAVLRGRELELL
jgi:LuxR family transcriptional regulator, maltose regulon positive regulatory protein